MPVEEVKVRVHRLTLSPRSMQTPRIALVLYIQTVEEDDDAGPSGGTLLPCPRLVPGQHFISVDIEKIGLKDADTYVDPIFTVSTFGRCK